MVEIIKVLLIDDDLSFAEEFIGLASYHNITIKHYPNLTDITEDTSRLDQVDFIVLDAHCVIDEGDTTPDFAFVPTALREIETIERSNNRFIPKCINTGYPEEQRVQRYQKTIKIFEKSTQQEELFAHIITSVKNSEAYQIKQQHSEVFEVFYRNYMDIQLQDILLDLLKPVPKVVDINIGKEYAGKIRSVQEAIYKTLNRKYPNILDNTHFNSSNNMLDFNKAKLTLSGKRKGGGMIEHKIEFDLQGSDLENISNSIYWVCGNILHYNPKEFIPYKVSSYTIQSLILALMEQLLWFKQIMKQQEKK